MQRTARIGIIGDFNPEFHTHPAFAKALHHSAAQLGIVADVEWVPTSSLQAPGGEAVLERFDGLLAASGSPYRSFDGMLRAVEFARTRNWPFVGT